MQQAGRNRVPGRKIAETIQRMTKVERRMEGGWDEVRVDELRAVVIAVRDVRRWELCTVHMRTMETCLSQLH